MPTVEFVVFLSDATNLIPGLTVRATVNYAHLYETNLETNVTTLVDVNVLCGGGTTRVSWSAGFGQPDGRYIAFLSASTDLVSQPMLSQPSVYERLRSGHGGGDDHYGQCQ